MGKVARSAAPSGSDTTSAPGVTSRGQLVSSGAPQAQGLTQHPWPSPAQCSSIAHSATLITARRRAPAERRFCSFLFAQNLQQGLASRVGGTHSALLLTGEFPRGQNLLPPPCKPHICSQRMPLLPRDVNQPALPLN